MAERLARKLVIVGWDAADWKVIDPLMERGLMPSLRRLVDGGVRGDLGTLHPMLSPMLWTSIATGKTADKHGILNFVEPDPAGPGLRIACSTTRRTKALWNILTQSGLRTHVVSWYASHPAEPISGACVSNLFQEGAGPTPQDAWPLAPGSVQPPAWADRIGELRLHPGELSLGELGLLAPRLGEAAPDDRRPGLLAKLVAQCASVHNVATGLLESPEPWDCLMVYFEAIDVVGHHFMQYHPPRMAHVPPADFDLYSGAVSGIYRLQDQMLGRLMELAGPDATVIVLSDHGFHSDHLRPAAPPSPDDVHAAMDATWHRPLGMLAMAGPGLRRAERIYGANLLDIAPTALTLLGLPVGADMDGRVLVEAFERAPTPDRVFSWDAVEGEAGMHPPDLRQDPFEAADAMRQLVDLGYVRAPPADAAAQRDLAARETRFNLAIVLMTTRRVSEAAAHFEALSREAPEEPRYVLNLAQCYHNLGRYAEARAILDRFLGAHPGHADARVHLGAALFAEGRLEEAGRVLERLEAESPGRTDLDTLLGTVYVFLRRWDDAARVFARAREIDPDDPRAHHGLGLVAAGRGRFEEGAEHCLRALELQHFYPDAHHTLGVCLTWMGDYEHAIRSFHVAVSMQPGLIDAHRYLASIYRLRGDRENAPRHRDIAERLMRDRAAGRVGLDELAREAPLGPQEWMRSLGLS